VRNDLAGATEYFVYLERLSDAGAKYLIEPDGINSTGSYERGLQAQCRLFEVL
jgi:hypothetical protein